MPTFPDFDFDMFAYIVSPTSPSSNHMYFIVSIPKDHSGSTLTINPYDNNASNYDQSVHVVLPDQSATIHTFMPVSNVGWLLGPPDDDLTSENAYYSDISGYSTSLSPLHNKYFYSPNGTNTGAPVGSPYSVGAASVKPFNKIYQALAGNYNIRMYLDNSLVGTYTRGSLGSTDYITNMRSNTEKITTTGNGLDLYPWNRPAPQVDTSLTWSVTYGDNLDISIIDVLDTSCTWSITPSLPAGLSFNVISSSMVEITGTSTSFDIAGTDYTISAANDTDDTQVQLNINIRDQWITRALQYSNDISVTNAVDWTISGDDVMDFSGYISNNDTRRSMVNLVLTRSQNSDSGTIRSTKTNLQLPSFFSKENIIIYRSNTTIDLATISADEGVYVPTYYDGETSTFLNTGGLQTVLFTASGDGVYKYSINGIEGEETLNDGDEAIIAGVSFLFGSIGTEGTNNGNICIMTGMPVHTERGAIPIEHLQIGDVLVDPEGNVLSRIKNVIRTVNQDFEYVRIPKDYYDMDMPYHDVILSKDHLVQNHNGTWVCAGDLAGVSYVKMETEYVYNVHAEDYVGMCVAGIAVETVHHNNVNVLTRRDRIVMM